MGVVTIILLKLISVQLPQNKELPFIKQCSEAQLGEVGEITSAYRILVVNSEWKRSLRSEMYGNIILALI
jgi:hypothetical protein